MPDRLGCLHVVFFKVAAPDFSAVFPNGAGRQAGHGQAALPFPDHSGWIIHHHRHFPPPQGRVGAAAGGRPDLSLLNPPPQFLLRFSFTYNRMESSVSFHVTHFYLDSFNPVYRRCKYIRVYARTDEDVTHGPAARPYWIKGVISLIIIIFIPMSCLSLCFIIDIL